MSAGDTYNSSKVVMKFEGELFVEEIEEKEPENGG